MSPSATNWYLQPKDTFKWDENNYFDRKDKLFRTLKLSFFGHAEDTQDGNTYVVTLVWSKIVIYKTQILILSRHLITEINLSCAKFAISYRPKAKCHITARLEKRFITWFNRKLWLNGTFYLPYHYHRWSIAWFETISNQSTKRQDINRDGIPIKWIF